MLVSCSVCVESCTRKSFCLLCSCCRLDTLRHSGIWGMNWNLAVTTGKLVLKHVACCANIAPQIFLLRKKKKNNNIKRSKPPRELPRCPHAYECVGVCVGVGVSSSKLLCKTFPCFPFCLSGKQKRRNLCFCCCFMQNNCKLLQWCFYSDTHLETSSRQGRIFYKGYQNESNIFASRGPRAAIDTPTVNKASSTRFTMSDPEGLSVL